MFSVLKKKASGATNDGSSLPLSTSSSLRDSERRKETAKVLIPKKESQLKGESGTGLFSGGRPRKDLELFKTAVRLIKSNELQDSVRILSKVRE